MSFSTFDITELPEESDNDYAIRFETKEALVGVAMTADEFEAVGQAMIDAAKGDMESWDGQRVGGE